VKFAFYDSLTDKNQSLVRGLFSGTTHTMADTDSKMVATRKGSTVTMNDGHEVIVVVSIPKSVREGQRKE
jgi:hypothetical protein